MVKKIFSVVLLASVLAGSSLISASAAPAAKPAASASEAKPEVKAVAAKPSVATRAVNAVKSTACSAAHTVKSAAGSAVSGVKSAGTKAVAASSAVVLAIYNASWVNHKFLTCGALATLAGVLLYNNNDAFRAKVRGFFGLDDQACGYCPSACNAECSSK